MKIPYLFPFKVSLNIAKNSPMMINIGTRELKSYRRIKFRDRWNKLDGFILLFIEVMVARITFSRLYLSQTG